VKQNGRKPACGLAWLAGGMVLTGVVCVVGCSEPGQGTAQVSVEARERLVPKGGPKAGGKLQSAAGKSFSIKERGPAAAGK
jgi:hypothetical protein